MPGAPAIVLALLCLMYLLMFVNRVNISTAAPLIKADLRLSNTQLGLVFSAFAIPYALFQLVGGWIAWGRPRRGVTLLRNESRDGPAAKAAAGVDEWVILSSARTQTIPTSSVKPTSL